MFPPWRGQTTIKTRFDCMTIELTKQEAQFLKTAMYQISNFFDYMKDGIDYNCSVEMKEPESIAYNIAKKTGDALEGRN